MLDLEWIRNETNSDTQHCIKSSQLFEEKLCCCNKVGLRIAVITKTQIPTSEFKETHDQMSALLADCGSESGSMFMGLLDPNPPVRGIDPDPSSIKQK
jgi:hypothetical protein